MAYSRLVNYHPEEFTSGPAQRGMYVRYWTMNYQSKTNLGSVQGTVSVLLSSECRSADSWWCAGIRSRMHVARGESGSSFLLQPNRTVTD